MGGKEGWVVQFNCTDWLRCLILVEYWCLKKLEDENVHSRSYMICSIACINVFHGHWHDTLSFELEPTMSIISDDGKSIFAIDLSNAQAAQSNSG